MKTYLTLTIFLLFTIIARSSTIYVDFDATGSNNGSSWANAYTDLQSALSAAISGDEIWVAEGTYKPTSTTTRTISFEIPSGVKVYGGFAGTETLLSQRDYANNTTILSGDIGTGGVDTDNSYHVVKFTNASSTTILDGFTITKGQADGGTTDIESACGGGIYNDGSGSGNSSNPQITNCIITYNYAYYQGGGVLNLANYHDLPTPPSPSSAGESSPTFTNCDITYNTTTKDGAGVNNEGEFGGVSSPTFTDCNISNNTAGDDGGGVCNDGEEGTASPSFTNCDITYNTASDVGGYGGAVYNDATSTGALSNSSPTFVSCTISNNEAKYGGGICSDGTYGTSNPTFTNCTINDNTATYGAGVYNYGYDGSASPTFDNCSITSNDGYNGGGVYNYGEEGISSPEFTGCNINSNTATNYGAGVYNYGYGGDANPVFTNCTLNGNICDYDGGAMYNYGLLYAGEGEASPEINNCTFSNNVAGTYEYGGGAIQNYGSGGTVSPIVKNTTFQNNTTTGWGGAICQMSYDGSTVSPQFINCLFIDNTATEAGGAFYDIDYDESTSAPLTTQLINCTFSNNGDIAYSADYTGTEVTIKNSIFWNNPDGELSATNGAVINVTYSDIEGGYIGTGNINSDPLFSNTSADDYRIIASSPCADVGDNSANSESYDIRGTGYDRKLNKTTGAAGTIDMGAYEYNLATDPVGTLTWDAGAGTSVWNTATNWNPNTTPTSQYNVVIPTGISPNPVISTSTDASTNNLTIQSGASLTIESDATGTGSLIVIGTATGNATVQRYLTHDKWHYISGQTNISGNFSTLSMGLTGGTNNDQFYRWDEALETSGTPGTWVDILNGNGSGTLMGSEGFVACKGYAINYITTDKTLSLIGVPYTSNQSITITKTSGSTNEGANLVGNPFTSTIAANSNADANSFLSTNSSLLDATYGGIYLWNEQANYTGNRDDYLTISNADAAAYIAPGQGFMIVKKDLGTTSLPFNTNMREHGSATFYKNAASDDVARFYMSVENDEGLYNEILIAFIEGMTKGLDVSYDAGKLKGNPDIALYTRLVEDNGHDFAHQALPLLDDEAVAVKTGLDVTNEGSYKFKIKELQNFDEFTEIKLQDKQTNTIVDLREDGEYSFFVSTSGEIRDRFVLHFNGVTGIEDEELVEKEVRVYTSANTLTIINNNHHNGNVTITNLMGQVIKSFQLDGSNTQAYSLSAPGGIYIVSIETDNGGVYSEKVFMK